MAKNAEIKVTVNPSEVYRAVAAAILPVYHALGDAHMRLTALAAEFEAGAEE